MLDEKALDALRGQRKDILADMEAILATADAENRDLSHAEERAFSEKKTKGEQITQRIDRELSVRALEEHATKPQSRAEKPIPGDEGTDATPETRDGFRSNRKLFRSFGEQLHAVVRAATNRGTDERLTTRAAAHGGNEAIGSEGGFLVQTDFSQELYTRAYEVGQVANKCRKFPIGAQFNATKIPGINESSRADGSRWGGVQAFWQGEADAFTASKPKFRMIELSLKKLTALCYATDEMLADAQLLESVIRQALTEELAFKLDDAVVNGTGAGTAQGILNAPALVTVSAASGSGARLLSADVLAMYARMWAPSRQNAVWFCNQDVEPQLYSMTLGTATVNQAVFLPPGGLSGAPYATLMGRPVVPVEQCQTLGTVGDIIFADMQQYALADKGGIQSASSMHVQFLTDEQVFRFIYRVDGQPMWQSALTPKNGSNTLSPWVAVAARS